MLAGKAVSHPEHMSVSMGMNAWRKWFDGISLCQTTDWFSQQKQQKQEENEGCVQRTRKKNKSKNTTATKNTKLESGKMFEE